MEDFEVNEEVHEQEEADEGEAVTEQDKSLADDAEDDLDGFDFDEDGNIIVTDEPDDDEPAEAEEQEQNEGADTTDINESGDEEPKKVTEKVTEKHIESSESAEFKKLKAVALAEYEGQFFIFLYR